MDAVLFVLALAQLAGMGVLFSIVLELKGMVQGEIERCTAPPASPPERQAPADYGFAGVQPPPRPRPVVLENTL